MALKFTTRDRLTDASSSQSHTHTHAVRTSHNIENAFPISWPLRMEERGGAAATKNPNVMKHNKINTQSNKLMPFSYGRCPCASAQAIMWSAPIERNGRQIKMMPFRVFHMCCGCRLATVTGYEPTEHIIYMTGFTHSRTVGSRMDGETSVRRQRRQSNKLN